VRKTARAGIRSRRPDYDALDVKRALRRLRYGDELVRKAWPREPLRLP
jgi:hypothetical protein